MIVRQRREYMKCQKSNTTATVIDISDFKIQKSLSTYI